MAVVSYPTEEELGSGACTYDDLRHPSKWKVERRVHRRSDGTDEALFPAGRVPVRSRKPADSVILYPGIRNRPCQMAFSRQTLWALARFLGRVKAIFLQWDLAAADLLESNSCHGSYKELVDAGKSQSMDFDGVNDMDGVCGRLRYKLSLYC